MRRAPASDQRADDRAGVESIAGAYDHEEHGVRAAHHLAQACGLRQVGGGVAHSRRVATPPRREIARTSSSASAGARTRDLPTFPVAPITAIMAPPVT